MSLETEFAELMSELTRFQSAIGRMSAGIKTPKHTQIVEELMAKIETARSEAESAVPAAIQRIHEVAKDVQQRAEEQKSKLAALQKQIEDRKQQEAEARRPAPPPADPPVDPELGMNLARELIQRMTPPVTVPVERPLQVIKEVWEDWNWNQN